MKGYHQLTQRQRLIIQDMVGLGKNKTEIARALDVHRTTISRELRRNCNSRGGYKALGAQSFFKDRQTAKYDYYGKIEGPLKEAIIENLNLGWSPEQISGRLKLEGKWQISHESIYRWIYREAPELIFLLRHRSKRRRGLKRKKRSLGKRPRKMISDRPAKANVRAEFGHWERDLLEGRRSGPSLLVATDRKSRLTKIKRVFSHNSEEIHRATKHILKNEKKLTITNDNGVEFGDYENLERELSIPIYFCQPYTSWQRGTVENINGLIRQFFPKRSDFRQVRDETIRRLEANLNHRPRKMHRFKTPYEIHYSKVTKLIKEESTYRNIKSQRLFEAELQFWRDFESGKFI